MDASDDTIWSIWEQVAHRVGGRFFLKTPLSRETAKDPGEPSIEATIDDVRVVVRADEYNWGTGSYHRTILSAQAKGAIDLYLLVTQGVEHGASAEGELEMLELEELNERYVVKANDEGLARLWLSPEARRLILGTYDDSTDFGYRFELNWENISIRKFGLERDEHRLEHAIRVAAALGRQGSAIMGRCRDLSRALSGTLTSRSKVWRPDATVTIAVGKYGSEVTVDHLCQSFGGRKQSLFTRVSKARSSPSKDHYLISRPHLTRRLLEHLEIDLEERRVPVGGLSDRYWIGGEELAPLSRRLDRHHQQGLLRLTPEAVLGEGAKVSLWLGGFVDDVERLRHAVELVEALSADAAGRRSGGPYR